MTLKCTATFLSFHFPSSHLLLSSSILLSFFPRRACFHLLLTLKPVKTEWQSKKTKAGEKWQRHSRRGHVSSCAPLSACSFVSLSLYSLNLVNNCHTLWFMGRCTSIPSSNSTNLYWFGRANKCCVLFVQLSSIQMHLFYSNYLKCIAPYSFIVQ